MLLPNTPTRNAHIKVTQIGMMSSEWGGTRNVSPPLQGRQGPPRGDMGCSPKREKIHAHAGLPKLPSLLAVGTGYSFIFVEIFRPFSYSLLKSTRSLDIFVRVVNRDIPCPVALKSFHPIRSGLKLHSIYETLTKSGNIEDREY